MILETSLVDDGQNKLEGSKSLVCADFLVVEQISSASCAYPVSAWGYIR